MKTSHRWILLALLALFSALAACQTADEPVEDRWPTMTALVAANQALGGQLLPTATHNPTASATLAPSATATITATPRPRSLAIPAGLPESYRAGIVLPPDVSLLEGSDGDVDLIVGEAGEVISVWVYVLVAPFPTLMDESTFDALQQAWQGAGPLAGTPLRMDSSTLAMISAGWGSPANGAVEMTDTDQLLDSTWSGSPASGGSPSLAIIPFEQLEPRWKVIAIDGQSPIHKDFDPQSYPLTIRLSVDRPLPEGWQLPVTNRDPGKLTTVVMTGVTALVRGTSNTMYGKGINYPAQDVGPWLQDADITHISNEVPFARGCPLYNPNVIELRFCTHPDYIGLLEYVGTDVVEMTGDHFIDQPASEILMTLGMYHERGWQTFGGGENLTAGQQPALFEHNGNKIAFVGCNAKGGGYALADETTPGAAECDFDKLYALVRQLRAQGYLVIATMQHEEIYTDTVLPQYRPDFLGFMEAGASIVQGSQAHQPQNFEFAGDGLIHYGLGNLFFDQIYELNVSGEPMADKAFIDRHVFYDGRYLSTELLTIQFVDYARSRPMTPDEREAFLQRMFKASGW